MLSLNLVAILGVIFDPGSVWKVLNCFTVLYLKHKYTLKVQVGPSARSFCIMHLQHECVNKISNENFTVPSSEPASEPAVPLQSLQIQNDTVACVCKKPSCSCDTNECSRQDLRVCDTVLKQQITPLVCGGESKQQCSVNSWGMLLT